MTELIDIVERGFERGGKSDSDSERNELSHAVDTAITMLDSGEARVAEKIDGDWHVHQWLKKAVLLSFRLKNNEVIKGGHSRFYDKVPLKYANYDEQQFAADGVRVVPDAIVRRGAYVAPDVVLMPSYVNIGANIDSGTMVDTWAEDDCFIGARSEVVEGVIVEKGSVLSMGVYIGQSTRIYDRETGETMFGRVPAGSVVVPGNLPSKDGKYSLYCAVIVKHVDAKTRAKTGLNELLRSAENELLGSEQ
jgi:2,3,4,5-tetrahydropyridine-2-carboxylate N-succinyltransferase